MRKTAKITLLSMALALGGSAFAEVDQAVASAIRSEAMSLIQVDDLKKTNLHYAFAKVHFRVDELNRIEVLKVEANSTQLEKALFQQLNQKSLCLVEVPMGEEFILPLSFHLV